MKELTNEQLEYAVGRLTKLIDFHGLGPTELHEMSGVPQPTISKLANWLQDSGQMKYSPPSVDVLKKLFGALGYKLTDVLNESDAISQEILGYLATPLTHVVDEERTERVLRDVVARIREAAGAAEFKSPPFEIYWPGEYTHPVRNANFSPTQVYRTDRSRASSFDFIILFCGSPSYGVGQENEISTQAGIPAIRIVPQHGISRMMSGSFIQAEDVVYSGTLSTGVALDAARLRDALSAVRRTYFRHKALYRGLNADGFGPRLRRLVDERIGNYQQLASDLGISLSYLHTLMEEPFSVSNPSAQLLRRMGTLLNERVGYLIGESEETDAVWVESNLAWASWAANADPTVALSVGVRIRNDWRKAYFEERRTTESRAYRSTPLTEMDWERMYRDAAKKGCQNANQKTMFAE